MTDFHTHRRSWHGLMRKAAIAAFTVLLSLVVIGTSQASVTPPGEPRPLCKVCRRFWDTSPSRIDFSLKFSHTVKQYRVCSLFCYSEFMEDYPDKEPETVLIVNYATLDQDMPNQLNLAKATYLYDAEGDYEKSEEPHVYAFATEKQAEEAKEDLGGEVVSFEEAMKRIKKLTDDYEEDLELPYTPLRRR